MKKDDVRSEAGQPEADTDLRTDGTSIPDKQTESKTHGDKQMDSDDVRGKASKQEADKPGAEQARKPDKIPESAEESNPATPDRFDPERLRLTQDFASKLGIKKALISVPVKKPSKEWWVRTHPEPDYRIETAVLELKEDREIYLIDPELRNDVATETCFGLRAIFTAVNRHKDVFLWPIRLPGPDGKIDEWSRSALTAALMAAEGWVRVTSNMSLGAYEVMTTNGPIPEPVWPDQSFPQLLRIAFQNTYIDTIDHPVLQRLRGEA